MLSSSLQNQEDANINNPDLQSIYMNNNWLTRLCIVHRRFQYRPEDIVEIMVLEVI